MAQIQKSNLKTSRVVKLARLGECIDAERIHIRQLVDQRNKVDKIVDKFPFLVSRLWNWPER